MPPSKSILMVALYLSTIAFYNTKIQSISETDSCFRCSIQDMQNNTFEKVMYHSAYPSYCNNPSFIIKFDAVFIFTIIINFDGHFMDGLLNSKIPKLSPSFCILQGGVPPLIPLFHSITCALKPPS